MTSRKPGRWTGGSLTGFSVGEAVALRRGWDSWCLFLCLYGQVTRLEIGLHVSFESNVQQ